MGQRRRSEEEIVEILREAETGEFTVAELCRKHGMSDAAYYKWKSRYGGVGKPEVRRIRDLEKENVELKKALGEHVIALNAVKDQLKKRGWD